MRFRELKLAKDPECPICGTRPTITELRESGAVCETGVRPGSDRGQTRVKRGSDPGLTPRELKARIDAGSAPLILDVREPAEVAICRIPGSRVIPLGELPRRIGELDRAHEIVVHCKSGGRSLKAVALLRQHGFDRAVNLDGGILRWISEIDPSLPLY
jgi:adenylyltransferase/sulfurtransferase